MDEILHGPETAEGPAYHTLQPGANPRRGARSRALKEGLGCLMAAAQVSAGRFRVWSNHTYHKVNSAMAGKPVLRPLSFLAIAAVVGISVTVGAMYTPSYVVTVDGQDVGAVRSKAVFEKVAQQVETRASAILGYDYRLDTQVSYDFALIERGELTPVADFEAALFNTIDEVFQAYTLSVNGQVVSAVGDRAVLDGALEEIKGQYTTENTISASFVQPVHLGCEYLPAGQEQTRDQVMAALTANTNGETVYEVVKGDTFMAIALDNNMTMAELEELNPGVDVNRLYIGQLLNVREEIPFLSVRTVDNITYTEEIACPVEEVSDDTMYEGDTRVIEAGVPGTASVNANVTYLNGKEEGRDILSSETLSEPTTRVIAVGTKERPSWFPTGSFIWPVQGRINSPFGWRSIFGSYSYHSGLDIKASTGQSIKAADGGTVEFAGWKGAYGNLVIINHGNGYKTYYGHNSSLTVSAGDKVYQGQVIAKAGSTGRSTGPHCHFEIRVNGTQVNPMSYLP